MPTIHINGVAFSNCDFPCMTSTGYLGYSSDLATVLATPVTSLETKADVFRGKPPP
jgi:hypothetical protein